MSESVTVEEVRRQLQCAPDAQHLSIIQKNISQITDPKERALLEYMFLLGQTLPVSKTKKHIVVLIHGIRTHAVWQERLAQKLTSDANLETFPIGYGFFDILSFWFPFLTRRGPINRVLRELRTLRIQHSNSDISVVAHSFGTYIMSQILSDETDIRLHRLQLCGSIIPLKYRWDKVTSRINGVVINDAGTRDYWPVIASLISWGYGPSGTFGFKTASVRDRFHNCGHSDFFSDEQMDTYWLPLLIDGQLVPSAWTGSRTSPGILISFLNRFPLKSFFVILLSLWLWDFVS